MTRFFSVRNISSYGYKIDGVEQTPGTRSLGSIPIMLRSAACNLSGLSPEELIRHGEHEHEWGGYFIVEGHERIIR